MKKFEFHLEKLLSFKGQLLDSEMMTLAVLNSLLENEQQKLLALQKEINKCKMNLEKEIEEKTTPANCQQYLHYTVGIKDQINCSKREIANISEQIDEQVQVIKNLKLETKSLETIKEARLVDYKREDIKRAELHIEEFVSTSTIICNGF